jgi:hypothetical protein
MDNLRKDYRHTFEPAERLHVEIVVPGKDVKLAGKAVNLSVGGVALQWPGDAPALQPADRCVLRFSLRPDRAPLELAATVVHAHAGQPSLGLQFLPPVDVKKAEATDRVLWAYLLDEQRRRQRDMKLSQV